jgi:hypothetical protein
VPLLAGVGALTSVIFFAAMLMVIFESSTRTTYSDAQWEAMNLASAKVDKEILEIECKKGERVSYDIRNKMEEEAEARALASVKEE